MKRTTFAFAIAFLANMSCFVDLKGARKEALANEDLKAIEYYIGPRQADEE